MNKFKMLDGLNNEQKEAAQTYNGLLAVVACPGAGKTKVLTVRTACMIEDGISPSSILLFTFTNKAANEIRERINNAVGDKSKELTIGTYHGICYRILRQYCHYLGYTNNFSIYDDDDKKALVKELLKDSELDLKYVMSKIAKYKHNYISPIQAIEIEDAESLDYDAALVYKDYQAKLKENNAFDFDDLINKTVYLLENYSSVKDLLNKKWRYIVSDESQDASIVDRKFIWLLSNKHKNLCMFLDNDQAIMGFRGADSNGILNMINEKNFKIIKLSTNYRSTKTIVNASRSVIDNNPIIIKKTIQSNNSIGEKVTLIESKDSYTEANTVAQLIRNIKKTCNYDYKDIAVLCRMQYLSRGIEEALIKYHIPYEIVNGLAFFQRLEVKDICSYLKFLINCHDKVSFERIINTPKRGIGDITQNKIIDYIFSKKYDTIKEIKDICYGDKSTLKLGPKANKAFETFLDILIDIEDKSTYLNNYQLIKHIIDVIGYNNYISSHSDSAQNETERLGNLEELANLSTYYSNIQDFVCGSMLSAEDSEESEDNVKILTMHAAKGLEYKAVIIYEASETIIPHFKSMNSINDIQEERRLFYTSMTRAKELLFITRAKKITFNGQPKYLKVSRFVNEINSEFLKIVG